MPAPSLCDCCVYYEVRSFKRCEVSRRGVVVSGVRRMNEVNPRRARLVLGWVTDFGRIYHLGSQLSLASLLDR